MVCIVLATLARGFYEGCRKKEFRIMVCIVLAALAPGGFMKVL
jgi:hypothetical protein